MLLFILISVYTVSYFSVNVNVEALYNNSAKFCKQSIH